MIILGIVLVLVGVVQLVLDHRPSGRRTPALVATPDPTAPAPALDAAPAPVRP